MPAMGKNKLGVAGENSAVVFLKKKGYSILERNFRTKIGEIDIVAKEGKTLCFVEVKARMSTTQGVPQESVSFFKQRKLSRLALIYLKQHFQSIDQLARFDVVSVFLDEDGEEQIQLIQNAFDFCV